MNHRSLATPRAMALVIAIVVGVGGCGSEGDSSGAAANTDDADDSYCASVSDMAASQPPAGSLTDEEVETSFNAYADAAERVADVSPPDQATTLREFAEVMRIAAVDSTREGLAERVSALGTPMFAFAEAASRDCDVSFDSTDSG